MLVVDEGHHISGTNLRGLLANHSEERLQIMGIRPHRVRASTPSRELQEVVHERMADHVHITATTLHGHSAELG
ncbi:MAG: hypothetical protein ACOC71_09200, partial [Hyphomicrobiales bacterium]